jgi:TrmH family RNA methyltransferase
MALMSNLRDAPAKKLRALKKRAARDNCGFAFIEGRRLVADALGVGGLVREIFVSESFSRSGAYSAVESGARAAGLSPMRLADHVFGSVSDTKTPQGVLAIIEMPLFAPEALMSAPGGSRILAMDRVADPGNAGTMIRTAESAGFSGVAMSDGCVDLRSPKTLRAAMGSAFRMPIATGVRLEEWLPALKANGFSLCAAAPAGGASCFGAGGGGLAASNMALVVGSEAEGIRPHIMDLCPSLVSVPMMGKAESLNAAVAAGLLMYETMRRRLPDDGQCRWESDRWLHGGAGSRGGVRDKAVPADAKLSQGASENRRQGNC